MKIITYLLLFAAMDTIPSLILWDLSPTDSVRVWYPTVLSYLGEHFIAAAATLSLAWLMLDVTKMRTRGHKERDGRPLVLTRVIGFGVMCVAVDVGASVELSLLQTRDAGSIRFWYTHTLFDYLFIREPVYVGFAILLLLAATVSVYRTRPAVTPSAPL